MPTYDYRCEANQEVYEVKHSISERLDTWGELCERAGRSAGDTPSAAPVRKIPVAGNVVPRSSLGSGPEPVCSAGPACCRGMCGGE